MPLTSRPLFLLSLLSMWLFGPGLAAPAWADAAQDEAAVRRVLDEQVAAWNRKDLEGYMAGYWKSPDLMFFSGGTRTRGWQPTLERYRMRYQGEGKEMGTLSFAELSVESLGPATALARGEWCLVLSGGKRVRGLFTVIFRRLPEGWRIVHDHSSGE
ncbi:MAG TPA: nuclear transport factor 2 family protein [Polyangia bacterium]|jgi:beta-aspartyl-peptidase (threonine type)|nr:nuclear transport factor 2 family protein [Polyangia bacterium]